MKYLNETNISHIGINWPEVIDTIRSAVCVLRDGKYTQPLKPYLRFNNLQNRIIAMPAYVGGEFNTAGIKWISSFPDNLANGIQRAHSIIILNRPDTGKPYSIINTSLLSAIRTAGVSGFFLKEYLNSRKNGRLKFNIGIIGFGPIGKLHLRMVLNLFRDQIENIYLYDTKEIDPALLAEEFPFALIKVAKEWEEVFSASQVLITCTLSSQRYINLPPRENSVYLNISLRDFEPDFLKKVDLIVVDNWEEVCREKTDIELAHQSFKLSKKDVLEITGILNGEASFPLQRACSVMFNPMGMAVFDIAIAQYYYRLAATTHVGTELPE